MFFSLYGKKRVAPPSPAQLLLLKQRQQYLQIQLLSKNNTPEPVKDVIVYEIGLDTESLEIPEPKLEEPMIQELTNSVVGEAREARERREIKEKEKPKKKVNFAEDKK
jgi:hypothetical protein